MDGVLSELRSICGEDNVSVGEAIREQHGRDESVHRSVSVGPYSSVGAQLLALAPFLSIIQNNYLKKKYRIYLKCFSVHICLH